MHKFHSQLLQDSGLALLSNSSILQAEGADAATFLQGQLSQNISKLEQHGSCFAGLSNPKGRLIASTYVYKLSDNVFYLVLPTAVISNVQQQLSKYVMRSKVSFTQIDNLQIFGLWNPKREQLTEFEHNFKLAEHCELYFAISEHTTASVLQTEDAWALQTIINVIPEVNLNIQEKFVAQMLNLDLLNGINFHKGCYTGQEVIARMQHLGRIKRRTLLLESNDQFKPGEKITVNNTTIGEVINTIPTSDTFYSLAVMQLDKIKQLDANALFENTGLTIFSAPYTLEQEV